jgi:signal transduction histidine kinase
LRLRKVRREFKVVLLERTRIAREMHDGLVQVLAGVVLQLETVQQLASQESAKQHFQRALDLARQGVRDARHAIDNLRSAEMQSVDFPERLRNLTQQQVENSNVSLKFDLTGQPVSLSQPIQSELLRICQESLQNILKHSEAQKVNIRMEYGEGVVRLSIQDDGKGFDPDSASPQGHFGLIGIRERAAELGAELMIQSRPGQGTLIHLSVPC